MKEQWKVIKECPSYAVSNFGKLKRVADGSRGDKAGTMLRPHLNKYGYYQAVLIVLGKRITRLVHRLVAQAFIPNPKNKPTVNHKDGNKVSNKDTNLEWATVVENNDHAHENGLEAVVLGEANGNHKFSSSQVQEIKNSKLKWREIALKYGISHGQIWNIKAEHQRISG